MPAKPPAHTGDHFGADEDRGRQRAYELLQQHTTWWQPGAAAYAASDHRDRSQPFRALYYRIRIEQVTGHQATPDSSGSGGSGTPAAEPESEGWARRVLRGLAGRFFQRAHGS